MVELIVNRIGALPRGILRRTRAAIAATLAASKQLRATNRAKPVLPPLETNVALLLAGLMGPK